MSSDTWFVIKVLVVGGTMLAVPAARACNKVDAHRYARTFPSQRITSHADDVGSTRLVARTDGAADAVQTSDGSSKVLSAVEVSAKRQELAMKSEVFTVTVPATIEIISAIPASTQEFTNVWGGAPTSKQSRQLARVVDEDGHIRSIRSTTRGTSLERVKKAFHGDSEYLLFVGHNEDGQFKLLDGTSLSLERLANRCKIYVKRCILVSCRAIEFIPDDASTVGLESSPTLTQGYNIVRSLERSLFRRPEKLVSLADVKHHLEQLERRQKIRGVTTKVVAATSFVVVVYVANSTK